ncbi:MAG: OmpA family protein [Ignavibacteria bacterium]|nr:OmpA family protein [Ignavibacteria bacterium]MBK7445202.1 OmpA family protein [Ignavibacteria bacterium]
MKQKYYLALTILFLLSVSANAQFKNYNVKAGIQYNQLMPFSEFDASTSFLGRAFLGFEINETISFEIGGGYGKYKTNDNLNAHSNTDPDHYVKTDIMPIDARLKIAPFTSENWNPYIYVGAGVMKYSVKEVPSSVNIPDYNKMEDGWTGIIPAGIGTEIKLSKNVILDLNLGATYSFTDLLNNFVITDFKDGYGQLGIGLSFVSGDDCNTDIDKDGLTKCREEQIGTDPEIADTDGDGCKDGDEVNIYKTNPLNKDTDGDTLIDCDEINRYNTNPLSKDTDSDKLMDNEEVNNYMTLPTDSDTDDDGLIDGDEVLTYKTNPKMVDTDLGSIGDGVEVGRGTDPLNANDDLPPAPPKEEVKIGTVIVLEGINFASGSSEISPGSETILETALSSMKNNPAIVVEISGHTDSRGTRARNMTLSKDRAESVKSWLVSNGIESSRIETEGYGPDKPIDTNDTDEGRLRNRRIEFKRIR